MPFTLNAIVSLLILLAQRTSSDGASVFGPIIDRYFLQTENLSGPGRFTDNEALRTMYAIVAGIAVASLGAVLTYTCLRSILEKSSLHARYTLKVVLPRLLVTIVLIRFGLVLVQGAIDLDNALVHEIWTRPGIAPGAASTLWATFLRYDPQGNMFLGLFMLITAVILVVMAVTSVARNLLLVILAAAAPLVFVGMLIPETRSYVQSWRRLFISAVFSQVAQVLVLRLSMMFTLSPRATFLGAIHGFLALLITLRVPGALHASSKAESKLMMFAHHAEKAIVHAVEHADHPARTRAHPAA